jgi:hypothetical protein
MTSPADLTDRDRELLAFAALQWKYPGARDAAIRDTFDITPTRYFQLLNELIDKPAAMAADPVLVKRLRRLRESRAVRRVG